MGRRTLPPAPADSGRRRAPVQNPCTAAWQASRSVTELEQMLEAYLAELWFAIDRAIVHERGVALLDAAAARLDLPSARA